MAQRVLMVPFSCLVFCITLLTNGFAQDGTGSRLSRPAIRLPLGSVAGQTDRQDPQGTVRGSETLRQRGLGAAAREGLREEAQSPDLTCTLHVLNATAALNEHQQLFVPVEIEVRNRGPGSAGAFKVSMNGKHNTGIEWLSLTAPGSAPGYANLAGLGPNESARFDAVVLIPEKFRGQQIEIYAFADSVHGEEFAEHTGRIRERNELNNSSNRQLVTVPLALNGIRREAPPARANAISQPESWTLDIDRIRLNRTDDGGGDEPYFIVIGFRARLNTHDSAETFWNGSLREQGSDLRAGSETGISDAIGRLTITGVRRMTRDEFDAGQLPEVIGWVVVAMESDAMPFEEVRDMIHREIRPRIVRELNTAVGRRWIETIGNVEAAKNDIERRVTAGLTPGFAESLRLGLASFGDPDDILNIHTFAFVCVDEDCDKYLEELFGSKRPPENPLRIPELKHIQWNERNVLRFDETTPQRLLVEDIVRARAQYDVIYGSISGRREGRR